MDKEIVLKGFVSEDGKIGEGNTAISNINDKEEYQVIKYVEDVIVKVYSADNEIPLEEIKKTESKQFSGKVEIHIAIKENNVVEFIIDNAELERYSKEYIGKYVCVLIQIKE